jgi:hypothetical protein
VVFQLGFGRGNNKSSPKKAVLQNVSFCSGFEGLFEHGDKPWALTKGREFLDSPNDSQLLKKASSSWSS